MDELNDLQPVADEITSDYANNTVFESTIWDLKLIFGEFSGSARAIEYHTSITVPWSQAKLIAFYLQANIAAYESEHGKIKVAASVIPPEWNPPSTEQVSANPGSQELFETLQTLRRNFLESLGS